jgi:hypothetical protein
MSRIGMIAVVRKSKMAFTKEMRKEKEADSLFEEGRLYYNGKYAGKEVEIDMNHALKCFYEAALLNHGYALIRYCRLKVYLNNPDLFESEQYPKEEHMDLVNSLCQKEFDNFKHK